MLKDCLKKLLEEYLKSCDFVGAEMLVMDDVLKILNELEKEYRKEMLLNQILLCSKIEHNNIL